MIRWALCIQCLFLTVFCCIILLPLNSGSTTRIVDDNNGRWVDFPTIQDAINQSFDGDTVRIFEGTYLEYLVVTLFPYRLQ